MSPEPKRYAEALRLLDRTARFGVRMGLERVERVLARLGRPHLTYPSVHLAGTNGKGSTAAMLAACLEASGHRTGLYTSPHLCRFTERIQVAGAEISRAEVVRLMERITGQEPELTFFELVTVMALCYFAEQAVEVAVIETGLGGRLDATNVVQPLVSVLTQIDLDHTEILGQDLTSIAGEKAGIIKRAVPVVSAPAAPEVEALLRERCSQLAAPLWMMDCHRHQEVAIKDGAAGGFEHLPSLAGVDLSLAGEHQRENAALCIAALELLRRADGIEIEEEHVRRGLAQVRWPGRLEWIGDHLLDGAHNPAGCRALARALPTLGRGEDYCLVLGAIGQRDLREMIQPLEPWCNRICLTRPRSPRAAEPGKCQIDGAEVTRSLEEALLLVEGDPRPKLIAGSLYLVGEARALLLGEPVDPWPTGDPGV